MATVAYHTLGCKVNQYDTQAMEELLSSAGFRTVPFPGPADIYLINTCTVTGTGDKKSLQLTRKLKREHPECTLILCGCLAQLRGAELLSAGADLVIGTQFRSRIVRVPPPAGVFSSSVTVAMGIHPLWRICSSRSAVSPR